MYKIALIKGDGIGPEVVDSTVQILEAVGFKAQYTEVFAGLKCFEETGEFLPQKTTDTVRASNATLFGAITTPSSGNVKSAIVQLRRELELFANLRPVKSFPNTPFL
ncbi:MAG: isocitrate/isopropylmalate family dehydrogenase, partial [Candidatus Diapherotrites archaeon]|nr:isocitrate/isopropylmalate family dehydrogenase [Candidatus Diapherotrites archaeon]